MKKYLLAFFIFAVSVNVASAATDCPFGLVNDPAPGDCGLYVDDNGNYTCDRSETEKFSSTALSTDAKTASTKESGYLSEEEMKKLSVSEVAAFFKIDSEVYRQELSTFLKKEIKGSDSLQVLHDEVGLCAGVAATIATSLKDKSLGGGNAGSAAEELSAHDLISGQELKTKTVAEVALIYGISANEYSKKLSEHLEVSIKTSDNFQMLHDNYDLSPSVAKDIATGLIPNTTDASLNKTGNSSNVEMQNLSSQTKAFTKSTKPKYDFILITSMILILYLVSFLTYKAGYIKLLTHRRIWNVLLLLSFLVSGIFGLMLVLAINYGWFIPIYAFILKWHVEFGIGMAIITIFHIISHYQYYACMIRRKNDISKPDSINN